MKTEDPLFDDPSILFNRIVSLEWLIVAGEEFFFSGLVEEIKKNCENPLSVFVFDDTKTIAEQLKIEFDMENFDICVMINTVV